MNGSRDIELECVDPATGERILDLEHRTLDDDERRLLEAHLEVCAHCALTVDFHRRLAEGYRDGSLPAAGSARRVRAGGGWVRWAGGGALAATLACLICLGALPPRPTGPTIAPRGAVEAGFIRPVEGEVIGDGALMLSWSEIPGAASYRVHVTGSDDEFAWESTATEARVVLPVDAGLETGRQYKVLLRTVPADLLPPGEVSVVFRTGGRLDVISHRIRLAHPATVLCALASVLLAAATLVGRQIRSR